MIEDRHRIGDGLSAIISARGAELHSIRTATGAELLWQAGPQWPRHAPVLFPIVGRLFRDVLIHEGVEYRMNQHGFARDQVFRFIERSPHGCRLMLVDDAQSRSVYPFRFRLEIAYRIEADTLTVDYTIFNPAAEMLPASLGAHPAFGWPLSPGHAPEAHQIIFKQEEVAPVRRVQDGLLRAAAEPTPIRGRHLALTEALFSDDALILDAPASNGLRYAAGNGGPALEIGWNGFTQLGLWSKPQAAFLCIEPWRGLASPQGYDGEFRNKPHIISIKPGSAFHASWNMTLEAP